MAFSNGPTIVTSGLAISLDAADRNSYPGSGTTWFDVSGNGRNGTLTNGPTFSSANGGNIICDGVDDYIIMSPSISYSEYTFSFFCKWISSVGVNERIFGSDAFGTYTIFNPTNVGFHYNPLGGVPSTVSLNSDVNVGYGSWCQVAVTVSAASTLVVIYINGLARNSWSTLPASSLAGNLFLGAQNTLYRANCSLANFSLYNRALSASEIAQNYNSTKTRFGL